MVIIKMCRPILTAVAAGGGRVLSFATSVDAPVQAIVSLTPSLVVEEP